MAELKKKKKKLNFQPEIFVPHCCTSPLHTPIWKFYMHLTNVADGMTEI